MQYMILPTDNDIQHRYHKYIDRIRTAAGKWRYIYKRDNTLRNRLKKSKETRQELVWRVTNSQDRDKVYADKLITAAREGNEENVSKYSDLLRAAKISEDAKINDVVDYTNNTMKPIEDKYYSTTMGEWEKKHPAVVGAVLDFLDKFQKK